MSFWPLRRRSAPRPDFGALPPPQPERLAYVVGDVHGCLGKLTRLLEIIDTDRAGREADLVFVGDYVDRGDDSAGVMELLHGLQASMPDTVHCLLGNHDQMLLEFLDDPMKGLRWLGLGGEETLVSYGIGNPRSGGLEERLTSRSQALARAMGADTVAWLRARPLWWRSGTLVAVHALTDPGLAMEAQRPEVLLWARPPRELHPREDGAWVVHGHTIHDEPLVRAGHVAIDTGAFRGGPLTAAVFSGAAPRYLASD